MSAASNGVGASVERGRGRGVDPAVNLAATVKVQCPKVADTYIAINPKRAAAQVDGAPVTTRSAEAQNRVIRGRTKIYAGKTTLSDLGGEQSQPHGDRKESLSVDKSLHGTKLA